MIKHKQQQAGVGLLELFMVLVIIGGIIFYSTQQYLSYKRDSDVLQVRYNVNALFQAMGRYFRANCNLSTYPRPNTQFLNVNYPQKYLAVTMSDLKSSGYLTVNLPISPLIDYSTAANGYIMQFNQVNPLPSRKIGVSPPATTSPVSVGQIILWQAQVSVLLNNSTTAAQYQQLLQADCLSKITSVGTNTVVAPCAGGAPPSLQVFAVFERQPSLPSTQANSSYWLTNAAVKQFTQMYTTDPILVLTDGTQTNTQYYVCGS